MTCGFRPQGRRRGVAPGPRAVTLRSPPQWFRDLGRLLAIALGGAVGGLARYGVGRAMSAPDRGWPWSTFMVNVSGAFALALLLVVVLEVLPPHRYVRPLLGTGFLGAYTTFGTW